MTLLQWPAQLKFTLCDYKIINVCYQSCYCATKNHKSTQSGSNNWQQRTKEKGIKWFNEFKADLSQRKITVCFSSGFEENVQSNKCITVPSLYADHPATIWYAHWSSSHDPGSFMDKTPHRWQLTWKSTHSNITLQPIRCGVCFIYGQRHCD